MKSKIRCISILILLAVSIASVYAYTDAELRYVSDKTITNLNYDTISSSYGDQGKDILLTISGEPSELNQKYVGLVYSDKELHNFVLISPDPAGKLFPIGYPNYQIEGNYIHSNIDLSTSDAVYPGIIYAVVSSDNIISADDALIQINPEKSWLTGADGGLPCMPVGNQWIIEGNSLCPLVKTMSEEYECPCGEDTADPNYDSYDISTQTIGTQIKTTILSAYWKNNDGYAVEIEKDMDRIIVEARDKVTGQLLDSAITSLNDEVTLDAQSSENIALYVNGIKTSEVTVEQTGQEQPASSPSTGGGSGSSDSSTEVEATQQTAGTNNNILTFTFDNLAISEIKIYLKKPVDSAYLELKKSTKSVQGRTYEYITAETNIDNNNINSVFVKFKVPLTWLTENSLFREEVKLNIQSGKDWNPAQTTIVSEDIDYIYYLSTATELSDFAVGDITKTAREESPAPVAEPTTFEQEAASEKPAEEKTTFREFSISLVTILLIIAIITIIIITTKIRKK